MEPATNVSARLPNEAWRDVVSTFWNTVDTIGVTMEFLPLTLQKRLELRSVDSRWNLAVCDSVKRLRCKKGDDDAALGALVGTFREVRTLSLDGCLAITPRGLSHLVCLGGLKELILSNTYADDDALDVVVRLPHVTTLRLFWCSRVTDNGVAKLRAMPQLESLDFRECEKITTGLLERLAEALPKLTSLSINGSRLTGAVDLSQRALTQPAATRHLPRFSRLTSLTARGVNDASIAHVCCLTGLTELDISNSPDLFDTALASLCKSLPRLTSLSLRGCPAVSSAGMKSVSQLIALTSLDIGSCGGVCEAGFEAISRLPALTTLRAERLTKAYRVSLSSVTGALVEIAKMSGLTELSLNCVRDIVNLQSLAPLTHLQILDLSGCDRLSDSCTTTICGFKQLRILNLEGLTMLSDLGLANIAQLPCLTELVLSGCWDVTDHGVALLSQLPSLLRLELGGCSSVSVKAIAALRKAIPCAEVRGGAVVPSAVVPLQFNPAAGQAVLLKGEGNSRQSRAGNCVAQ